MFSLTKLEQSRLQKLFTYFMRGVSLMMIPVGLVVPSVSIVTVSKGMIPNAST